MLKAKFFLLFVVAAVFSASAADRVTATITVTNAPTINGDTLVVNAATRTWTNNTTGSPSTTILTNSAIGGVTTNLWYQITSYPFAGNLIPLWNGTNSIKLVGTSGGALAVSFGGTWAQVSYATNTVTEMIAVRVPLSSEPTQSSATNIASLLALGLDKSTNAITAGITALQNVLQTTGDQSASGAKSFSGANIYSNATQQFIGGTLTNIDLGATNAYISNLFAYGPVYFTNTFPRLWFWDSDGGTDEKAIELAMYDGALSISVWDDAVTAGVPALTILRTGTVVNGIEMHEGEIEIGDFSSDDKLTVQGITKFPKTDLSTLANGNNANVDFGATTFARITIGPTIAFAICGIAGGSNGRMLIVYNATGQDMTISNESGVDPTPANRIITMTGGDISTTGAGVVTFIYDSSASRWLVASIKQ